MSWSNILIDQLSDLSVWNYPGGIESYVEPAAFSALAFLQANRVDEAQNVAAWIAGLQQPDGRVGISESHSNPAWPTSLAILAWQKTDQATQQGTFRSNIKKALSWALRAKGTVIDPAKSEGLGHDTTLVGWPWVIGTHSWIEPTSFFVLAFSALNLSDHVRAREAVRILLDRQLPRGGCNYGNTVVLGSVLKPHPQPSGIAMMALAAHYRSQQLVEGSPASKRNQLIIKQSLNYLTKQISKPLGPTSRCFVSLGLAGHVNRVVGQRELQIAFDRRISKNVNAYQLALCYLANTGPDCILFEADRLAHSSAAFENNVS